jgi:hypothetical protein
MELMVGLANEGVHGIIAGRLVGDGRKIVLQLAILPSSYL